LQKKIPEISDQLCKNAEKLEKLGVDINDFNWLNKTSKRTIKVVENGSEQAKKIGLKTAWEMLQQEKK